ncbi:MAG: zinc-binding dehydrogenase [Candidatus Omnitrophica bacterium]|nr:zinc-binding dehydrogenase [Candidatus Omnitrophota bacterium]
MKAAVVYGDGKVVLREVPRPELGPYQCLVKILACATCTGTDHKIARGGLPYPMDYPAILGHEGFGRVVKTGLKVRYIKEGDFFLRPTSVYPGEKLGDYFSAWGGFAEYGLVTDVKAMKEDNPQTEVHSFTVYQQPVPADLQLDPADATMLITLKETASFLQAIGTGWKSSVAILGTGPVAMGFCWFAKVFGAWPVIVIGRRDEPERKFKKLGVDFYINNTRENMTLRVKQLTDNQGVDYVVDAAGDLNLLIESTSLLAPKGKLAPYATSQSYQYVIDRSKGPGRWSFVLSGPDEPSAHQYLLDAIRLGLVKLKDFYSHRLPLTKIAEGFKMIEAKQAFKIVFEMGEE